MVPHRKTSLALPLGLLLAAAGCDGGGGAGGDPPATYEFPSRFGDGSSVAYPGQVMRQVLIDDMKAFLSGMTEEIDGGGFAPAEGDVVAALGFYYEFDDSTGATESILTAPAPGAVQSTYGDIASGKDLRGKIAGRDSGGEKDYKDWDGGDFMGWSQGSAGSPDELVQAWFEELDALAVDRAGGTVPEGPGGNPIGEVYVTEDGRDLRQLLQKFLWGAVTYAQATDDYLDEGLTGDNTMQDGDAPYTVLEHHFDEGYGYFGAARDYADYTDELIAGDGYMDTDGDGAIDLQSERVFGHAAYAAKRDNGSAESAPTDFTGNIFGAFLRGRHIIASAGGELTADQRADLEAERDVIVENWERVIAASVIHYINSTLQDMETFGTADYDFLAHAEHWSEAKGFALALQFNPRKKLSDQQFMELHEKLGDAPVLPGSGGGGDYKQALRDARQLLADVYGFDPANVGDDKGEGGW